MLVRSVGDIAAVVRGRRLELGWTQADVAARIGVSRVWVNALEGGKLTVELAHVLRLFDALGLRCDVTAGEPDGGRSEGGATNLDALLDTYRTR